MVQAALEVRAQLPNVQDIAAVNIETLQTAVNIMAGDAEKWRPTNRETADHSMPYTAAVALRYGSVNQGHFDDAYLQDNDPLELTSKVHVQVSEEANRRVPEAMLCKVEVVPPPPLAGFYLGTRGKVICEGYCALCKIVCMAGLNPSSSAMTLPVLVLRSKRGKLLLDTSTRI